MSFLVFVGSNIKMEVNKMFKNFVKGFIQGVKETPRGYFAPAVAIWRLLLTTTDSLLQQKNDVAARPHNPLDETSKGGNP